MCFVIGIEHSRDVASIPESVLVDVQVPLSELVRSNLLGDDGAGKPSQDSLSEARDEVRCLTCRNLMHVSESWIIQTI
jgi:hypothetical protein